MLVSYISLFRSFLARDTSVRPQEAHKAKTSHTPFEQLTGRGIISSRVGEDEGKTRETMQVAVKGKHKPAIKAWEESANQPMQKCNRLECIKSRE